ncbi:unnamed protein product (macronuclear) [Paramecium tetraurelia]|uniref:ATP-dependent DNA ligase family profile domain-containing protein n=1 Tax=Paramecium tetraurelia TaxID=5888 RepID=A0EC59_PARTE|nr:uncharacterized protein GSPATT00025612001 [Paramecium tetraurelia]CAK92876.1 unnamed protein product [Paramecium tetraurelia]|eukprot:XP_001460273.1 hypothetical protein (macronuclear) [Paramecium tetraurelia strain d4-2]
MKKYLQCDSKFWSITIEENDETKLFIRYGNLCDYEELNVKKVEKQFPSKEECQKYCEEASKTKEDKGYQEVVPGQQIQQQIQKNDSPIQNRPVQTKQQQKQSNAIKRTGSLKPDTIAAITDDALNGRQQAIKGPAVDLGKGTIPLGKVMLAQTWNEEIDPKGYYLSEKLDGMRMIWTGSKMYSRNGNPIQFPDFFVQGWPKSYLDGELWLERDQFSKLVSITKRQVPVEDDWRKVKYMVFDAPGLKLPFKDRYLRFKQACEQANQYIVYVPHIVCKGYDHLIDELEAVQDLEGEGLMLRDPDSTYEQRRSDKLLKVKTFMDDEATVLAHEEGTGRCQGMLGSLKVKNTSGIVFNIGSGLTDDIRQKPPKIGSRITYKYYGVSKNNVPRFPIYLRERPKE